MTIYRSAIFAAAFAALVAGGCSHETEPGSVQPMSPPVQGAPFTVHVTNELSVPMNVSYRYGANILEVLGTVPAGKTMDFSVANRGGDGLEIQATDENGGHFTDKTIDMKAGRVVTLDLK